MITTRHPPIVAVIALALWSAGCAADDDVPIASDVAASPDTDAPESSAAPANNNNNNNNNNDTVAPISSAGSADSSQPSELSVIDRRGATVTLEQPPTRVVSVWDSIDAQNLLALGIEPVLVGRIGAGRPAPWVDDFAGIDTFELGDTANIERIAAARPDLIVSASYDDASYEVLEEVAPLYVADNELEWRDELRNIAALLGLDEVADDVIAEREAVIADTAERLADWQGSSLVAGVVVPGGDGFAVFTDRSPLSALVEELGLAPLTPARDGEPTETYSLELLGELEGDALLFLDVSGIAGQDLSTVNETFLNGDIINTIPAVSGGIALIGPESSAAARLVNAANLDYLVNEIAESLGALER